MAYSVTFFVYLYIQMAYLYRHIRKGIDEVFYIGIGSDNSYKRARDKRKRNYHWNNIVKKYGYIIEIMMDDLTWEQSIEKEKEFIKLYGREDLGEGTLVNMTDGGEGTIGMIIKESSKKLMVEKIAIPVLQYDMNGEFIKEWQSSTEASRELNIDSSGILKCCKGTNNRKSMKGFIWRFKDPEKWFSPIYTCETGISEANKLQRERKKKVVLQLSLEGDIIKEWKSPKDASVEYNITAENIYRAIKFNGIAVNYKWKYK